MNRRASSISEQKCNDLYPEGWVHDPTEWEKQGIVFEEDPKAGDKLNTFLNHRAHCKKFT